MNLSLIGYRGTGKSTIAAILARKTGLALTNLDAMIVARADKPIPEIVAESGWDHFRDLESAVLADAAAGDAQVLDCGGGIILREDNRKILKAAGPVVWLTAAIPAIVARIKEDANRPSLTGKSFLDEIADVLAQREPLYRAAADHVIATDELSPAEATLEIIRRVGIHPFRT
jgi:shikimate kinase